MSMQVATRPQPAPPAGSGLTSWDLFCRVIDNLGDLGVCWRLACDLATRGHHVRLWVDDGRAQAWMAPQGHPGVELRHWKADPAWPEPHAVVVEAFGCELDDGFKAAMARRAATGRPPVWLNLEYLSAEAFVERNHALESPQGQGPAAGLRKWFFYPGFTTRTGGLLREPDLAARQSAFDRDQWLAGQGMGPGLDEWRSERLVSLFCYEPPALPALLSQLAQPAADGRRTRMLVTHGRAAQAVRAVGVPTGLAVQFLGGLSQRDYDHLLWSCDLNFVRGEDSLVRALWAGRPFVWQIYPQSDGAHAPKLEAFLGLAAPDCPSWQAFHRSWNGLSGAPLALPDLAAWGAAARAFAGRLQAQTDLTSALVAFVTEKS